MHSSKFEGSKTRQTSLGKIIFLYCLILLTNYIFYFIGNYNSLILIPYSWWETSICYITLTSAFLNIFLHFDKKEASEKNTNIKNPTKSLNNIIMIIVTIPFIFYIIPLFIRDIMLYKYTGELNDSSTWLNFWGSYIGAIGTISLGIIALWQNKRYKKLSDKSFNESKNLQEKMADLNEKTSNAIEVLKRIELGKYTPEIEKIHDTYFVHTKEHFLNNFPESEYEFNTIFYNTPNDDDLLLPVANLIEKYNSFSFIIRNIGEKTIRNLSCSDIIINSTPTVIMFSRSCDMQPDKSAVITIINFPKYVKGNDVYLNVTLTFKNLLMDEYEMKYECFIDSTEEGPNVSFINFDYFIAQNSNQV